MKLILEKWKAYSQKCKNSDGKTGSAVVKKTNSSEVESCHMSMDKAKDAVKARYANYKNENLDEVSAMAGGAVVGHVDDENLDELLSTSGMISSVQDTRGLTIYLRGNKKEHDGYIERSKYQKLKNISEE